MIVACSDINTLKTNIHADLIRSMYSKLLFLFFIRPMLKENSGWSVVIEPPHTLSCFQVYAM